MPQNNYVIRVLKTWAEIDASEWNALAQSHEPVGPFMRHEYLAALHDSGSAVPETGWRLQVLTAWQGQRLAAACPVYLKSHSYGEYVFDWAWANAYQQHGLSYYPKALVASPFTPVPGPRLLAVDDDARLALVQALLAWCQQEGVSSLHLLFLGPQDLAACQSAGLMHRQTV
jgi:predicted N-acyltransferase